MHASAAGFDTPNLYTARHQGMGGAAIGYVSDPSAGYHNPAGLSGIKHLALLGDFSLVLATIQSSPTNFASLENRESELIVGTFFLLGAGYRFNDWITLGVAGFPVASGGAEYRYTTPGAASPIIDETRIVFFEVTPMLSVNTPKDEFFPGTLSIGVGYRVDFMTFERRRGEADNPTSLNLDMSGTSAFGYRIGLQYRLDEHFSAGIVYRSKVEITTTADDATVFNQNATDAELPFVLPARAGIGARYDFDQFGIALDLEYAFQSQNDRNTLEGEIDGTRTGVPNVFEWSDAPTVRVGGEYRLGEETHVPLRVGYMFDGKTTNERYPSAFGTPPTATHTMTAGTGYVTPTWQANIAATYRLGSTRVDEDTLGDNCQFCSFAGDYEISALGLYVDASIDFEL